VPALCAEGFNARPHPDLLPQEKEKLPGVSDFADKYFSGCRRKKWRGFGNFVPEFFIDAGARGSKISGLVHKFI